MKEITHEEARKSNKRLFESYLDGDWTPFPTRSDLDTYRDYITQQQAKEERAKKEHELLKEHIQLSYDLEYMLVHGIKDDMKYTKTANRLFTVREKLQDVLNWKLESELK